VRVLPETFGPPVRLAAGTYRTRPGFNPVTTFTVGRGWHGAGSSREWVVGKGFNAAAERFRGASIWVSRLSLRYATAVATFRALKTLEAGPRRPIRVGGYPGVVFQAKDVAELGAGMATDFSGLLVLLAGVIVAAATGYLALRLVIDTIKRGKLWVFGEYTAVLGAMVIFDSFVTHIVFKTAF
jgi:hypothetical protein